MNVLEMPRNNTQINQSQAFVYRLAKFKVAPQLYIKTVFSSLNLLLSLIFLIQLRSTLNKGNIKDRVVKVTILCEICFNIMPSYAFFIYLIITGNSLSIYIGQFAVVEIFFFLLSQPLYHKEAAEELHANCPCYSTTLLLLMLVAPKQTD
uniref:Uncharacterized protein n=1 Tax=Ditylenchus dipsaci TaxID=166011 RepID=A0A915END4_9BILA